MTKLENEQRPRATKNQQLVIDAVEARLAADRALLSKDYISGPDRDDVIRDVEIGRSF